MSKPEIKEKEELKTPPPPASEPEEKKDEEILFPEREIYGVKLHPWTWDEFISILPLLVDIRSGMKKGNVKLEDLLKLKDQTEDEVIGFITTALPLFPAPEIISRTTDIPIEEVKKWIFDKTASIFFIILIQNAARVKNLFGLGLQVAEGFKKVG